MTAISASMVKDLRARTGAGMMDCKTALKEANGNLDNAMDWLRTKGLAAASKKSSRVAAEGLVGLFVNNNIGSLIEVNSETDFVAKNNDFQAPNTQNKQNWDEAVKWECRDQSTVTLAGSAL